MPEGRSSLDQDNQEIEAVKAMKIELLADADALRRLVGASQALGDMLTGDVIAEGTAVVRAIGVRNHTPIFPKPLPLKNVTTSPQTR